MYSDIVGAAGIFVSFFAEVDLLARHPDDAVDERCLAIL
jgi:hypothetical protein